MCNLIDAGDVQLKQSVYGQIIMKKYAQWITLLCLAASAQYAAAKGDIASEFSTSGNVTFANDYRFRGISQTDNEMAIQGALTLAHQSGFYVNLWASNVDLFDGNSIEIDYFLGYQWAINEKSSLDIQYIDVNYPGVEGFKPDFVEYALLYQKRSTIAEGDSLSLGVNYSPDYALHTGDAIYLNASASYPIYKSINLIGGIGYTKLQGEEEFLMLFGEENQDSYLDYKVGLTTEIKGIKAELSWVDTSLDVDQKIVQDKFLFSLSKNF